MVLYLPQGSHLKDEEASSEVSGIGKFGIDSIFVADAIVGIGVKLVLYEGVYPEPVMEPEGRPAGAEDKSMDSRVGDRHGDG